MIRKVINHGKKIMRHRSFIQANMFNHKLINVNSRTVSFTVSVKSEILKRKCTRVAFLILNENIIINLIKIVW